MVVASSSPSYLNIRPKSGYLKRISPFDKILDGKGMSKGIKEWSLNAVGRRFCKSISELWWQVRIIGTMAKVDVCKVREHSVNGTAKSHYISLAK